MINLILTFVFAGFGALLLGWGYLARAARSTAWLAAASAAAAAAGAYYDSFWTMTAFGAFAVWAAVVAADFWDAGLRARIAFVGVVVSLGLLSLWPSASNMSGGRLPCPTYVRQGVGFELVAGLDLRGGMRLVYTVDVQAAIEDRRDRFYEDMRGFLAKAYGFHSGDEPPSEDSLVKLREKVVIDLPADDVSLLVLRFTDPADAQARIDARFQQDFSAELGQPKFDGGTVTFRMRNEAESRVRERAVQQAREIISRRVDEMGLKEAAVSTRDEDIIVEVPGNDEAAFDDIKTLIGQTARLEFKMVDDDSTFFEELATRYANPEAKVEPARPDRVNFRVEQAPLGVVDGKEKNGEHHYAYWELAAGDEPEAELAKFQAWMGAFTPPPDREIGYELVERTDDGTAAPGQQPKFVPVEWRTHLLKRRADVTGDMVTDARAQPDQSPGAMGNWEVGLDFTDRGGRSFAAVTTANVHRRFAIVLDGRVKSTPNIIQPITGGHAKITMGAGDATQQVIEARNLELVLRSGALPAPIALSNSQRIGPSLGMDAIRMGVEGALGGSIIVVIFMALYYRRAGVIADVAVTINVLLQLAILASFGAAMTLPGIAGMALTVGMSVDSNVLINERIREELRDGKSPRAAVEIGFERATSAIIDGQLTTIIAGVVLAQYGTGPIKGFAVTLIVGVLVSVFTGVFVSRAFFDMWVRGLGRQAKLDVG